MEGDDEMSVIFDNKIFGSNFGSGTLAVTLRRLGNVSTRGQVGTGDNILIGGLIVGGSAPKPVVVRALGPTLTQFGVTGVLADPYLELRGGNGNLVEANNDWQQSPEASTIMADGKAPSNAKESAIAPTLTPGQLHRTGPWCRRNYGYGPG